MTCNKMEISIYSYSIYPCGLANSSLIIIACPSFQISYFSCGLSHLYFIELLLAYRACITRFSGPFKNTILTEHVLTFIKFSLFFFGDDFYAYGAIFIHLVFCFVNNWSFFRDFLRRFLYNGNRFIFLLFLYHKTVIN